jgi:hypothetical protein
MNKTNSIKTWIQSWWTGSVSIPYIFLAATTSGFIQVACSRVQPRKVTIEKKDKINEYKKGKDKRKSVPVSPALYHGIFMLKSNVDTSIELDTIMCANWLIDWLLKVQQAIFQSYSGWEKFVNKKSERGDSGMGQHGQRLNTGTCFSVSSDDKLVLFLFPGIPTGDPAIVAFYDKRIYKKLRLKELSLSDPLYHGKKQHRNMTK